ncbi:roadblock/LC7 domain-containing protein [Acinetobacter faecalis]|uniref:roadblock/LC7 domain-containing protein n=1 Tax=Acinetobacter faecalis TaxID=2665161 RepID=UPI002A91FECF|nr:roadblock/LC7 domain-containing protein [Acinetobacter faecalis]MDY6525364.1 roadblock/LC7 domain-containing protein [Acinetobacter faecalis]
MHDLSRKPPESLIHLSHRTISDVLLNVKGVDYILLCTADGFEISSVHNKNIYNSSKLAAVSSSIVAMISAFVNEIDLKGCQSITLDAENGKAILNAIPNKNYPMIMVALTNKDILLGQVLFFLKKCTEDIISADSHYSN